MITMTENELKERLKEIICEKVRNIELIPSQIGDSTFLMTLEIDSMYYIAILAAVDDEFDVRFYNKEPINTINSLAAYIKANTKKVVIEN